MENIMIGKKQKEVHHYACIDCIHCHLFHRERNNNKYYCQTPGKPPLFISQPHISHSDCKDFILRHHVLPPLLKSLCDKLQESLLSGNYSTKELNNIISTFSNSLSHNLHEQLYGILDEIATWENELTQKEIELSSNFYFELAAHAILRIAHLQNP